MTDRPPSLQDWYIGTAFPFTGELAQVALPSLYHLGHRLLRGKQISPSKANAKLRKACLEKHSFSQRHLRFCFLVSRARGRRLLTGNSWRIPNCCRNFIKHICCELITAIVIKSALSYGPAPLSGSARCLDGQRAEPESGAGP